MIGHIVGAFHELHWTPDELQTHRDEKNLIDLSLMYNSSCSTLLIRVLFLFLRFNIIGSFSSWIEVGDESIEALWFCLYK